MSPLDHVGIDDAEYTVYGLIPLQSSVHGVSLSHAVEFIQGEQWKARSLSDGEHVRTFTAMTKEQIVAVLRHGTTAESGVADCGMVGFRRKALTHRDPADQTPMPYEQARRTVSTREPLYA